MIRLRDFEGKYRKTEEYKTFMSIPWRLQDADPPYLNVALEDLDDRQKQVLEELGFKLNRPIQCYDITSYPFDVYFSDSEAGTLFRKPLGKLAFFKM